MEYLDRSYVRKILGPKIFERAEDYRKSGNILETSHDDQGWIRGLVQGSYGTAYDTAFNPETGEYSCSCPFGGMCKHVGALMLDYIADARASLPAINAEAETDSDDEPAGERIIAFDSSVSSGLFSKKKTLPARKDAPQRFRLVFIVSYAADWRAKDFFITPAIQFLKKDGEDGRIERFDERKISEPVGEAEQEILAMMHSNGGSGIPLIDVCDLFGKNQDIRLYLEDGRRTTPVRIAPLKKIIVSFRVSGFSGERSHFTPLFSVPDGKQPVSPQRIVCTSPGILAQGDGVIFHSTTNRAMRTLLSKILSLRQNFTYGDIRELESLAASDPSCGITVDFKPAKMKLITEQGKPILEIEERYNGASAELFFDYSGREIPYSLQESLLNLDHLNADSAFFHMAKRLRSCENAVRNRVRERLAPAAIEIKHGTVRTHLPLGQFLERFGRSLIDEGITLRMKKARRKVSGAGKVAFRLTPGIDWFDTQAVFRGEDGTDRPIEVDIFTLESGLVKAGDEYVFIGKDDIERLAALEKGGLDRNGRVRIHKLDFSAAETVAGAMGEREKKEIARTLDTYSALRNIERIEPAEKPKGFRGELRQYQVEGYNWLCFLHQNGLNGCLADDMGLGKTVQTLALLQKLKEKKKLRPALLVVPVSTVANWEQEIARFTPGLTVLRHLGIERGAGETEMRAHDIVITSYHTLRNDIGVFSGVGFSALVLDEAQNIKNASTKVFRAVKALRAPFRLALSGTPIENSTGELWALFDVLNPGLLGTKESFASRFARPIEKHADADAAKRLRALIFPFILRRKKEMVAKDLPDKEEIVVYCEMEPTQRKIYEAFRKQCRAKVEKVIADKGKERGAIEIFEALLKLRQIALFPALASKQFAGVPSCKFDLLSEMLDDILVEDHKALVFSQFVQSLAFLEELMKERKVPYSYIDGSTKNRKKEIDAFQSDPARKVFLLSLKAGGVGINLTAADYVILFDPWWNPAAEAQAVDRSHRIGQTRKVTAYRLIVKDSIEEKILALQEKKRALVSELITEEASFFKSLSGRDIVGLFD